MGRKWRFVVGGWAKTSNVECDDRGEMERCGSLKRVCDFSGMQAKRRRCWLWTSCSRLGSLGAQTRAAIMIMYLFSVAVLRHCAATDKALSSEKDKTTKTGARDGHEEPSSCQMKGVEDQVGA